MDPCPLSAVRLVAQVIVQTVKLTVKLYCCFNTNEHTFDDK